MVDLLNFYIDGLLLISQLVGYITIFLIGCWTYYEFVYKPLFTGSDHEIFTENSARVLYIDGKAKDEFHRIIKHHKDTGEWDIEALNKLSNKFK